MKANPLKDGAINAVYGDTVLQTAPRDKVPTIGRRSLHTAAQRPREEKTAEHQEEEQDDNALWCMNQPFTLQCLTVAPISGAGVISLHNRFAGLEDDEECLDIHDSPEVLGPTPSEAKFVRKCTNGIYHLPKVLAPTKPDTCDPPPSATLTLSTTVSSNPALRHPLVGSKPDNPDVLALSKAYSPARLGSRLSTQRLAPRPGQAPTEPAHTGVGDFPKGPCSCYNCCVAASDLDLVGTNGKVQTGLGQMFTTQIGKDNIGTCVSDTMEYPYVLGKTRLTFPIPIRWSALTFAFQRSAHIETGFRISRLPGCLNLISTSRVVVRHGGRNAGTRVSFPEEIDETLKVFLAPSEVLREELAPRQAVPLNALGAGHAGKPGYRLVEGVVESGASKSTGPRTISLGRKMRPPLMSKKGLKFVGPDGGEMPNYGEIDADWLATKGHKCRMTIQMPDVDRCLLAVTELNDAGNDGILRKLGGEIANVDSGKRIALQRNGGVYV